MKNFAQFVIILLPTLLQAQYDVNGDYKISGNVGIGTANPRARLELVNGDLLINRGGELNFSVNGNKRAGIRSTNSSPFNELQFFTGGNIESMRIDAEGNVGIGTNNPRARLEVVGGNLLINRGGELNFSVNGNKRAGIRSTNSSPFNELQFFTGGNIESMRIDAEGNVGIGTTNPNSKLAVNGTIHAKEVKVDLSGWPDFVFENGYELLSLEEVENYIIENKHLPEIPNEAEVNKNGIKLGEMDAKLLRKIEELTLYLIRQNKELKSQGEEIERLKRQLENK